MNKSMKVISVLFAVSIIGNVFMPDVVFAEQDPNEMSTVSQQMQKAIENIRRNDRRGIYQIKVAAINAMDKFIASDPNREISLQHVLNDGTDVVYSHDKDGVPQCIKCAQKLLLAKGWILSSTCTKVQSGNQELQQYNFTIKPEKHMSPQNPDCDCNAKLEWPGTPDPGFPNGQIE